MIVVIIIIAQRNQRNPWTFDNVQEMVSWWPNLGAKNRYSRIYCLTPILVDAEYTMTIWTIMFSISISWNIGISLNIAESSNISFLKTYEYIMTINTSPKHMYHWKKSELLSRQFYHLLDCSRFTQTSENKKMAWRAWRVPLRWAHWLGMRGWNHALGSVCFGLAYAVVPLGLPRRRVQNWMESIIIVLNFYLFHRRFGIKLHVLIAKLY